MLVSPFLGAIGSKATMLVTLVASYLGQVLDLLLFGRALPLCHENLQSFDLPFDLLAFGFLSRCMVDKKNFLPMLGINHLRFFLIKD